MQIRQINFKKTRILFPTLAIFLTHNKKNHEFAIFVGNLPFDVTDDSLVETFSKYGKLVRWDVKRDRNTNRSLGYGFVSFEKAEQAVQALNGGPHLLKGRTLRVDSNKRQTLSKKAINRGLRRGLLLQHQHQLLNVSVFERQLEIFLHRSSFYPDPDRQFNVSKKGFFDGTVLNHIPPTVLSNRDIPSVFGAFMDDGVFFGDVSLPDGSSFHFMPTKGDVLLDGKAFHSIVYRKEDVRPEWGPTNWKGCAAEICSRSVLECFCPYPFNNYMFECLVYYDDHS